LEKGDGREEGLNGVRFGGDETGEERTGVVFAFNKGVLDISVLKRFSGFFWWCCVEGGDKKVSTSHLTMYIECDTVWGAKGDMGGCIHIVIKLTLVYWLMFVKFVPFLGL
jgi:hypothetical protein